MRTRRRTADGPTDFRYDDVYLVNANGYSNAYVAKSGFGRSGHAASGRRARTDFSSPTAALFTTNCGTGQSIPQFPAIGYTNYTSIYGGIAGGRLRRGEPKLSTTGRSRNSSWENAYIPAIRINNPPYGAVNINIYNFSYADILGGYATPAIDLTNSPSNANILVTNAACATGYQPLFEVGTSTNYQGLQVYGAPCSYLGANNGTVSYNNASFTDPVELEHAPAERFARRLSDGHSRSAAEFAL